VLKVFENSEIFEVSAQAVILKNCEMQAQANMLLPFPAFWRLREILISIENKWKDRYFLESEIFG
jgi:hypothetical protein